MTARKFLTFELKYAFGDCGITKYGSPRQAERHLMMTITMAMTMVLKIIMMIMMHHHGDLRMMMMIVMTLLLSLMCPHSPTPSHR